MKLEQVDGGSAEWLAIQNPVFRETATVRCEGFVGYITFSVRGHRAGCLLNIQGVDTPWHEIYASPWNQNGVHGRTVRERDKLGEPLSAETLVFESIRVSVCLRCRSASRLFLRGGNILGKEVFLRS